MVLLADMPLVTPAMVAALAARWREGDVALVGSRYGESDGAAVPAPPVLYGRALFAELTEPGDRPGREVVRRHRAEAAWLRWPEPPRRSTSTRPATSRGWPRRPRRWRRREGHVTDAQILEQAAAWLAAGRPAALATVLATWGSSPRPVGSQLAATADGAFVGSVSGGCVEAAVVEEAAAVLAGAPPRLLDYGVTDERAWSVGLACGGRIEMRVERAEAALLAPLLDDLRPRRPAAVVTRAAGRAAAAPPPGRGAAAPRRRCGGPWRATPPGSCEGADGPSFLRAYPPPVRLVAIVGAVHITQALAPMARLAGFDVVVVDPRRGFATPERLPGATLVAEWPDAALRRLGPDARTAVVALSHDPKLDDPALFDGAPLRGLLRRRAREPAQPRRPPRAAARRGARRGGAGAHPRPGRPGLGAVSPGEIAASILAELVLQLRRPEAAGVPPLRGG